MLGLHPRGDLFDVLAFTEEHLAEAEVELDELGVDLHGEVDSAYLIDGPQERHLFKQPREFTLARGLRDVIHELFLQVNLILHGKAVHELLEALLVLLATIDHPHDGQRKVVVLFAFPLVKVEHTEQLRGQLDGAVDRVRLVVPVEDHVPRFALRVRLSVAVDMRIGPGEEL